MRALKRAAEAALSGPAAGRYDHLPRKSEAQTDREADPDAAGQHAGRPAVGSALHVAAP
jgi:hypothetical protein